MDGLGVVDHETLGADYLRRMGFAPSVYNLVNAHVDAKRYLAATKPSYRLRLSEASRGTLAWQGGPMREEEQRRFENRPDFKAALAIRSWDEAAKQVDLQVARLEHYAPLITRHLAAHEDRHV